MILGAGGERAGRWAPPYGAGAAGLFLALTGAGWAQRLLPDLVSPLLRTAFVFSWLPAVAGLAVALRLGGPPVAGRRALTALPAGRRRPGTAQTGENPA